MKKLILTIVLGLLTIWLLNSGLTSDAWAADPEEQLDLAGLKAAGLSAETIGRLLAQNLDPDRAAPQTGDALMAALTDLGGDELAVAYLDFDRQTAHLARRDFSPDVIQALMDSGLEAAQLKKILASETIRAARQSPAAEKIADPAPTVSARPAGVIAPAAPVAPAAPSLGQVKTPSRHQAGYQDLRPGQAADPALRLPPPPATYDLRRPRTDGGRWLGVTERELADGHRVEVNLNGSSELLGQEVISRPSGHKVYRYYSGRPDNPVSGPDQAQEQKNREDLMIIHGGGGRN